VSQARKLIYCNCTYAKIIPEDRKREVLEGLSQIDEEVIMVPDLCESAAKKDPMLNDLLNDGPVCVIACYKRSVKWLAHNAEVPWNEEQVEVLNMREEKAESILKTVGGGDV
jgi:hypothetical protein